MVFIEKMNEIVFFLQVGAVSIVTLIALRMGKESLISWICLQAVFANLFVTKQITLWGFDVTCSDAFVVGGVVGLNLLQEYFGKRIARRTIGISFFLMVTFVLLSHIHLLYLPNSFDMAHPLFVALLRPMPRIMAASAFTYLIVQLFDTSFYGFLQRICAGKYLAVRASICLCISQLLDTLLFSMLGLYGMVGSITDIMLFSFVIKLLVIGFSVPFIVLSRRLIAKQQRPHILQHRFRPSYTKERRAVRGRRLQRSRRSGLNRMYETDEKIRI